MSRTQVTRLTVLAVMCGLLPLKPTAADEFASVPDRSRTLLCSTSEDENDAALTTPDWTAPGDFLLSDERAAALGWPAATPESRPGAYWWWPGSAVTKEDLTWNLETYRKAGWGNMGVIGIYGVRGEEDRFIEYLLAQVVRDVQPCGGRSEAAGNEHRSHAQFRLADGRAPRDSAISPSRALPSRRVRSLPGQGRIASSGPAPAVKDWRSTPTPRPPSRFTSTGSASDSPKEAASRRGRSTTTRSRTRATGARSFWTRSGSCAVTRWRNTPRPWPAEADAGSGARRVLCDYRETLSDVLIGRVEQIVRWGKQRGSGLRMQAHGAPANLLDMYAAAEIPETEVFGASQFDIPGYRRDPKWIRPDRQSDLVNRFASSAAHVAGRNVVISESFTWLRNHYHTALSHIKAESDKLLLNGINCIYYHGICFAPKKTAWPGWLFYASTQANARNSIFRDVPALNAYITRCQSVLQEGRPHNDVLLYWPVYDLWMSGGSREQRFSVHHPDWIEETACGEAGRWMIDHGYTFDFVSDRQLLQTRLRRPLAAHRRRQRVPHRPCAGGEVHEDRDRPTPARPGRGRCDRAGLEGVAAGCPGLARPCRSKATSRRSADAALAGCRRRGDGGKGKAGGRRRPASSCLTRRESPGNRWSTTA